MEQQDRIDFITAFAVGTALGAGAALLIRPKRAPADRIVRDFKPHRKRMRKNARRARKGLEETADATASLRGEIRSAGRLLLEDFQDEFAQLLISAREELARTMDDQVVEAKKALKRSAKRLRKP